MLVVDDNSPDGTADLARAAAAELGQIDVLVRPKKDGLGNAYRHGFRVGIDRGYEVLVQMDADLSHDPAALPSCFAALDDGAEAVIGSRYVPGGSVPHWPWYRRALSKWGNRYACFVLGMTVHDATAGFRAYRVDTLKAIDVFSTRAKGYGFQIETAYRISRSGRRLAEVPITFTDRVRGVLQDVAGSDERGAPPRHLVGHPRPRRRPRCAPGASAPSSAARGPPGGSTGPRAGLVGQTGALDVGDHAGGCVNPAVAEAGLLRRSAAGQPAQRRAPHEPAPPGSARSGSACSAAPRARPPRPPPVSCGRL